jgi:hypothetical protein
VNHAVPRSTTPVRYAGTRVAPAAGAVASGRNGAPGVETAQPRNGVRPSTADRTSSPRYINRGDRIVRSQTERPTPPRSVNPGAAGDTGREVAVSRTAPPASGARSSTGRADTPSTSREGRAGDHPAYRPSPSGGDSGYRAYERAVPRTQEPAARPDQPQTFTPRQDSGSSVSRTYPTPYAGDRVYRQPYAGDRTSGQPSQGDRAYERPSAGDRAYERPYAGRSDGGRAVERAAPAPPPMAAPSARPVERPAPAPSSGRPMERAAPAPSPAPAPTGRPSGGQGGERAVPRGGGRGGGRSR